LDVASSTLLSRRCFIILASLLPSGCVSAAPDTHGPSATQAEPIRLDTADPRYAPYLTLVRDKIQSNWRYPCIEAAR
jgi:hypothetical protein